MGDKPVNEITTAVAHDFAAALWTDKQPTASVALGPSLGCLQGPGARPSSRFLHCRRSDCRTAENGYKATKQPAMAHSEVSKAMAKVRGFTPPWAALAIELQVLTAVRPNEAQGAMWSEIDLDAAVWVIPASRMKAKKEHRVPLSSQAVALLKQAQSAQCRRFGFPGSAGGKSQAVARIMRTLSWASDQEGRVAVAHGFRSSFRNWAGEESGASHDAIEAEFGPMKWGIPLSKSISAVTYWKSAARLMQAWADYLTK